MQRSCLTWETSSCKAVVAVLDTSVLSNSVTWISFTVESIVSYWVPITSWMLCTEKVPAETKRFSAVGCSIISLPLFRFAQQLERAKLQVDDAVDIVACWFFSCGRFFVAGSAPW